MLAGAGLLSGRRVLYGDEAALASISRRRARGPGKGTTAMHLLTFLIVACALVVMPAAATQTTTRPPTAAKPPQVIPSAAQPVKDILVAQPFTLNEGYRNDWSKQRSTVTSGVIVVLEADPRLAMRREAAEPILYAGNTPLQRLNNPGSGRVIGIVPGVVDLSGVPIWFGSPGLPDRVTPESARAERAQAGKRGITAFPSGKLRGITRASVAAPDLAALLRDHIAPLVLQYSPEEKELAESWRLPVVSAPRKPQPR